MTVRFMLGLGLIALTLTLFAGGLYWLFNRKRILRHGKHRMRRRGRAVRIDAIMVKPDEPETTER
jgi:hypothetical protein